jgi:LysR family glycine cleavage system transcriptional activator
MLESIVPVTSPALAKTISSPADLLRCNLLNDESHEWDPAYPDWETWLQSLGLNITTPLRIRHFSDSNLSIQAAMEGLGVTLVWHSLVADELRNGRLVQLFGHTFETNQRYHLVTTAKRLTLPKVKAFREWLLAQTQSVK